mmetsp:Transcript_30748/g.57444  ORF Transcript_30748/g.57444 Transcript_30748/m.57444 type:complete len:95 (+) Transcript_30748:676-960(+)
MVHNLKYPIPGGVEIMKLDGIIKAFSYPDVTFAAWMHFAAFDCLIGLGIVTDAKRVGVPHWMCIPCLLMCMLVGPLGFLIYLLLRIICAGLSEK